MHLLEDLTSVPHTRNDPHPIYSPYEAKTKGLKPNIKIGEIQKTNSIQELFKQTALYTNTNFLSKDSIFTKYKYPEKDYNHVRLLKSKSKNIKKGFLLNRPGGLLIKFILKKDTKSGKETETLEFDNYVVLASYWHHLSQKAVESGVSLLDLFFREVEKEKRTNRLGLANMSYEELLDISNKLSQASQIRFKRESFDYKPVKIFENPFAARNIKQDCKDTDYKEDDEICSTLTVDESFVNKLQGAVLANKYYKAFLSGTESRIKTLAKNYIDWSQKMAQAEKARLARKKKENPRFADFVFKSPSFVLDAKAKEALVKSDLPSDTKSSFERESKKLLVKSVKNTERAVKKGQEILKKSLNSALEFTQKTLNLIEDYPGASKKDNTQKYEKKKEAEKEKSKSAQKGNAADDFNSRYKFLAFAAKAPEVFSPGGLASSAQSSASVVKHIEASAGSVNSDKELTTPRINADIDCYERKEDLCIILPNTEYKLKVSVSNADSLSVNNEDMTNRQ